MILELQVREEGEEDWHTLSRRQTHAGEVRQVRAELTTMMWEWQSIRCFEPSARFRVHENQPERRPVAEHAAPAVEEVAEVF